jgi:ribosomal protein S18 acetylase RimI-like enzyme
MISIVECDFSNRLHTTALIRLMNDYMADEMGGKRPPYTKVMEEQVIRGLEKHPSKLILLAMLNGEFVGLANCFINFGTFAGKPFINIHDIVVLRSYRGKRIGQCLMEKIALKARKMDCAKITLEVRTDNLYARKLYKKLGYKEGTPPMHFWTKYL